MPGGDVYFFRETALYRSSSETSKVGLHWKLRPGERNGWSINPHRPHKEGDPDLEAVIVGDEGTESLWRNAVSAELDKDLWPTLSSTPLIIRLALRMAKLTPLIGDWLWTTAIAFALRVQLRVIYHPHSFYVWSGDVPFTKPWDYNLWVDKPPEWAQKAEWRSAELLSIWVTRLCWFVGSFMLGMKDTYEEYYHPRDLPSGDENASKALKPSRPG